MTNIQIISCIQHKCINLEVLLYFLFILLCLKKNRNIFVKEKISQVGKIKPGA